MTRIKRSFTLLEILIAMTLLTIAAGGIGWKMHSVLKKRRFKTDIALFQSQILAAHHLAIAAQADWEGILQKQKGHWIFKAACTDPPHSRSLPQIKLHVDTISFNQKQEISYQLIFFSTGEIRPKGLLSLKNDGEKTAFDLNQILGQEDGDGIHQLGPIHPDDT